MTEQKRNNGNSSLQRRTLLKGAAASAALLPAGLSQSQSVRASSESRQPFVIDVHHHSVPDQYVKEMNRLNYNPSHGKGFPRWSPQTTIDVMDQYGIAASVTSVSSPGVYIGDKNSALSLARNLNEYSAKVSQQYSTRLGYFAILPMPLVEDSIKEALYALDELNADGIVLLASSGEKFLGDPDFDELMAELNKREAVVFIHPNVHPTSDQLALDIPGFYLEFMFDTTRAVTNLIYSGTMEKYQKIKWIVAHAGATLPYLTWRLSLANVESPEVMEKAPRGVAAYLKTLHYDTALSPSPTTMASLLQLVEPTQILFGSDFPFAPDPLVGLELKEINQNPLLDDQMRKVIYRDNALRLFPRFATEEESQLTLKSYDLQQHEKLSGMKRFIINTLKSMVD